MSSDQGEAEGFDKASRRRLTLVLTEQAVITQLVETGNASKLKRVDNHRRMCRSRTIQPPLLTNTNRNRTRAEGRIEGGTIEGGRTGGGRTKGRSNITKRGRGRRSL